MDDKKIILTDIAHYSPGMIYQFRMFPDGRSCFPFASEGIEAVYGLMAKDVLEDASAVFDLIHPDDLKRVNDSIKESMETLTDWECEYRVLIKGKGQQWLLGHSRPIKLNDGSVLWNGFLTNITARKKVEEELARTNRLFQVTAQINHLVLHLKNREDVFREACRIATTYGGFKLAWIGIVDHNTKSVVPVAWSGEEASYLKEIGEVSIRQDLPQGLGPTGTAARENKTIVLNQIEKPLETYKLWREKALRHGFYSSIALPITVMGNVIATYNLYADIPNFFSDSEIKLLEQISANISFALAGIENDIKHRISEEALKASERNFRLIFDEAPLGIAIINSLNGEFFHINPQFLKIIGRSLEETKGLDWMKITHPDDVQEDLDNMSRMNSGMTRGFKMSKRYIRPNGEIVWIDMSVVALDKADDGTPRHLCMVEDITKRKQSEESLKRSEEMFSAIANLSPDVISVIDHDGEILFNSSAAFRIHGYKNEEIVGKRNLKLIHPDDEQMVIKCFEDLYKSHTSFISIEYRLLNKDGSYSWVETTAHNQLNNPHINGIIAITREVGVRKKLEEDLMKALEVRDEFISIASHELKTPLTTLKLQLQMMTKDFGIDHSTEPEDRKVIKSLTTCNKQINRISELIEKLLDVTRIETGKFTLDKKNYDVSDNLKDILEGFIASFREASIHLDVKIEPNLMANLDKGRIEQVFSNLISNSIKYAQGKDVMISLTKVDHHIHFIVADKGIGISEEKQKFLFRRFERISSSKHIDGLGLGLYITKQIVLAHNGSIDVESKLGEGTTFIVKLPINSSAH